MLVEINVAKAELVLGCPSLGLQRAQCGVRQTIYCNVFGTLTRAMN